VVAWEQDEHIRVPNARNVPCVPDILGTFLSLGGRGTEAVLPLAHHSRVFPPFLLGNGFQGLAATPDHAAPVSRGVESNWASHGGVGSGLTGAQRHNADD